MNDASLPRISIVIPSLDQGEYLGEALASLFRQGYPRLEVVVMDGGSRDSSLDVIRAYESRITFWRSHRDGGQSAAINEGVAHCSGDLVAWLNADDCHWGNALWTVARAWAAFPGCGLYSGDGYVLRDEIYTPFRVAPPALNRQALVHGINYILQPATFFLRRAWDEVGGLDPDLHYCMDWDVTIRIAQRHRAALIDDFLAVNRDHPATKTRRGGVERAAEILRVVRRHSGREVTTGGLVYLLETLFETTERSAMEVRWQLLRGLHAARRELRLAYGTPDGFPTEGDRQDQVFRSEERSAAPPYSRQLPASHGLARTWRARVFWSAAQSARRRHQAVRLLANLALAAAFDPRWVWQRGRRPLSRRVDELQLWAHHFLRRGSPA